jgi:translation initiation factor IF-2
MPVRIYDIAKKLGIESKAVLTKAKELGITGARVPSSSLDKITAEYLEDQIRVTLPPPPPPPEVPPAAETPPQPVEALPPAEVPAVVPEITLQTSPVELPAAPPVLETPAAAPLAPAVPEPAAPEVPVPLPPAPMPVVEVQASMLEVPPPTLVAPPAPPPPPPPPTPKVGDLVGRIQLPLKPSARMADKAGGAKVLARTAPGVRAEPQRTRGDTARLARGGGTTPSIRLQPGGPRGTQPPGRGLEPATPAAPLEKITLPENAEVITLKPPIIIRDLAEKLNKKPHQVIAELVSMNVWATVNQAIEEPVAQRVCAKFGFKFEVEKRKREAAIVHAPVRESEVDLEDKPEDLKPRAPVVTIMGHVDHGKTSLLDVIRKSNVVAGEAGGITQHIGAYTISVPHPERKGELAQITFLDTPGHAAFTAMRARGANVTDIVVLVVAANDGVMPQTLEALNHARAAKVPLLVAVNKIDHPNAAPLKVRQQLQDKGLVPDDWGGDTIFVDVSALTKQGVDKLLAMILLQAELLELKANPNRPAKGNVIESGLTPAGPTATVLVRKGTLRVGDTVLCGTFYGRVRALINEEGKRLKEAGPSVAVKVLGLNGVPEAGVEFAVMDDERTARTTAEQRVLMAKAEAGEARAKVTLETIFETLATSSAKVLKAVVKADTQGSVEAIVEELKKIESDKVSLEIIHSAVGTITEGDVDLAAASHAIILGFHTRIDVGVSDVAKREGVQIKLYTIIYELVEEVRQAMAGLLEPALKENVIGAAEVRKVFELSKGGKVAGCVVTTGRITRGKVRVMRRRNLLYEGVVQTLRRFQDDVNEVRAGMECGIRVDGFDDFLPGDSIEAYSIERVAQKL